MKRAGFTMIELIFVIVILGILAAVAIPKLAATRDDAKIAKGATELATAVADFGAYYTAQGAFANEAAGGAGQISNVFAGDTTDMNASDTSITLPDAACISITALNSDNAGGSETINVAYDSSAPTAICKGIASAAGSIFGKKAGWDADEDANLSHKFGGTAVKW